MGGTFIFDTLLLPDTNLAEAGCQPAVHGADKLPGHN